MPTKALVATRAAIDDALHMNLADTLSHEAGVQRRLSASDDFLEGVAAFIAKRPAVFSDR
jgi:2-(1,2-epoxy-1,2-dihydrophenyl)acetyl-CoA isomerase